MFRSFCIVALLISGCAATTVRPLPPSSLKSSYRKTVEVIMVGCEKVGRKFNGAEISVVESTETGERFHVHGCLGRSGDRFKISY